MRLLYALALCLVCSFPLLMGQSAQITEEYSIKSNQPSRKQLLRMANRAWDKKNLPTAFAYYESIAIQDSSDTEALYLTASLADSFEAVIEAVRYFEIAAKNEDRTKYPMLDFQLANNYQTLGYYDKAIQQLQRFRQEYTGSSTVDQKYIALAKQIEEDCRKAKQMTIQPNSNYKNVKRLDYQVNTDGFSEFAPYEVNDTLYFSRLFYGRLSDTTDLSKAKFNVYVADGNGNGLNSAVSSGDQNAHVAFSLDGKYMYDTDCQYLPEIKQHRCKIYRREKNAQGNWGNRQLISGKINLSGYNATHPAIGKEENGNEVLYFSSDRPAGKGGMDIWKSVIITAQDGTLAYSEPLNVEQINTSNNEITPFYHNNCEVLYFSSDKQGSLGGYDIYESKWNGRTLETAKSLGYPLNSSFDDVYFFRNASGLDVYFASKRIDSLDLKYEREYKGCCLDIFSANLDLDVNVNIAAYCGTDRLNEINFTAIGFGERGSTLRPITSAIALEVNEDYQFTVSKSGYTASQFQLRTNDICESTTYNEKVYIRPLENTTLSVKGLGLQNKKERLDSVNVTLIDTFSQAIVASYKNVTGEQIKLSVEPEKTYKILASSNSYIDTSLIFTTPPAKELCTLDFEMVLVPDLPELPLPDTLYFHNAIPLTIDKVISYKLTYDQYFLLIPGYKAGLRKYYLDQKDTVNADLAAQRIDAFFEDRVERGYDKLNLYASAILEYLKRGRSARIEIQGTASPRASVSYNKALSTRRVNSVKEYLRQWNNGALSSYIDKELVIVERALGIIAREELGEDLVKKMEKDFGIYDPISASLRRVVILEISSNN